MNPASRDVAQIRLANALRLFDEFVHATVKNADAATLRGLESRFAERLQIQPSYWSQIKGRSRQIGDRLARQFEQLCKKPPGWMDEAHAAPGWGNAPTAPTRGSDFGEAGSGVDADSRYHVPQDDDERFIVGLVLTYYRRHPQRARARLLDLLGEVLSPGSAAAPQPGPKRTAPSVEDGDELWQQTRAAIKPLKSKR